MSKLPVQTCSIESLQAELHIRCSTVDGQTNSGLRGKGNRSKQIHLRRKGTKIRWDNSYHIQPNGANFYLNLSFNKRKDTLQKSRQSIITVQSSRNSLTVNF